MQNVTDAVTQLLLETYSVEVFHYVLRVFVVVFTPVDVRTFISEKIGHLLTGTET